MQVILMSTKALTMILKACRRSPLTVLIALALVVASASGVPAQSRHPLANPAGSVVSAVPLPKRLWIPKTTAAAFRLTYVTSDSQGDPALSTGAIFIPKGLAPKGGWPVISWAHGTFGLGDDCAPSVGGSLAPDFEHPYFANWMRRGYAIVATDYAGLGTAGVPAYLNGISEAHNVVDMVKAGRQYASTRLPATQRLSKKWVVLGHSQGGGAAIYTARWASEFGGPGLRYLGASGTGVPANIETLLSLLGPKTPPVSTGGDIESYVAYILAALRANRPELQADSALTPTGKKYANMALTKCLFDMYDEMSDVPIGSLFSKPLRSLPNWNATINAYMKMPTDGFDKPFFIAHGVADLDVPYATTAAYVAQLVANGEPVSFKSYVADHEESMTTAQKDQIAFVDRLFHPAN